jgi:hypothetical protein
MTGAGGFVRITRGSPARGRLGLPLILLVLVLALAPLLFPLRAVLAAGQDNPWARPSALAAELEKLGFKIRVVSSVPRETAGLLIVTEPRPTAEQLEGLWAYVLRGGSVILPLEVPVEGLDDPLVNTVTAGGGRKVYQSDRRETYQGHQYVFRAFTTGTTGNYGNWNVDVYYNLPTYLSEFDPQGCPVEVHYIHYSDSVRVKGGRPPGGRLIAFMSLRVRGSDGKAVVMPDHSVVTNRMFSLHPALIRVLLPWVERRHMARRVYWLGPPPLHLGDTAEDRPGNDSDESDSDSAGWEPGEGKPGFGPFRGLNFEQLLWLALPAALLPIYVARRPRWQAEDFLTERATETRFRRLVRGSARADNYALPARALATEVARVLTQLSGSGGPPRRTGAPGGDGVREPPGRLSDYLQVLTTLYAERRPGATSWQRHRFRRFARRTLAELDRYASMPPGGRVTAKAFVRTYSRVQHVMKEIGGADLYGRGALRRNHQA